jgi:hypothetical protein
MKQTNLNDLTPKKALITIRIIWLALMLGQLTFLVLILAGVLPKQHPVQPQPLLAWINLGMLLTIVPVAFVIRTFIFKRSEVDGQIPAQAFSTGNIIFWAACEGVSFSGLVFGFVNGSLWPTILIVAVALGLQVLTFPVGGQLMTGSDKS